MLRESAVEVRKMFEENRNVASDVRVYPLNPFNNLLIEAGRSFLNLLLVKLTGNSYLDIKIKRNHRCRCHQLNEEVKPDRVHAGATLEVPSEELLRKSG
uniref:Uncharacterized protein n=1 Tax=Kalanchoe fedtschenkoi TaxID=63787 RepID=A0A7N0U3K1_KALFE